MQRVRRTGYGSIGEAERPFGKKACEDRTGYLQIPLAASSMSRLVRPTALLLLAIAPPCALAMVATNTGLTGVKSRLRSTLAAHDYSTKAIEVQ
eukprot:6023830-Pleurochrysis_carterae.AAC.3